MKRTYYDAINAKAKIEIEVNAKVAHFLEEEEEKNKKLTADESMKLPKQKRETYLQKEFEDDHLSLNHLIDNGFQPCGCGSIEQELIKKYREEKYLHLWQRPGIESFFVRERVSRLSRRVPRWQSWRGSLSVVALRLSDRSSKHIYPCCFDVS